MQFYSLLMSLQNYSTHIKQIKTYADNVCSHSTRIIILRQLLKSVKNHYHSVDRSPTIKMYVFMHVPRY